MTELDFVLNDRLQLTPSPFPWLKLRDEWISFKVLSSIFPYFVENRKFVCLLKQVGVFLPNVPKNKRTETQTTANIADLSFFFLSFFLFCRTISRRLEVKQCYQITLNVVTYSRDEFEALLDNYNYNKTLFVFSYL